MVSSALVLSVKRFAVLCVKYSLLVAALLVTAGVSALVTMRAVLLSQEVKVPPLVGRRIPEAGTLAARQRLQLRVEGQRHDSRVPMDAILAQEPPAGSTLKSHRSIKVWLSLGPRRLNVPRVQGESLRTAILALEQSQVPVARVVQVNDAAAEGLVMTQHPAPGDTEAIGEGATLLVSLGPPPADYVMPDLIGRLADEVVPALESAGLKVGQTRYRTYPGVAPGIVLRQSPPAGHRLRAQVSVVLDVSKVAE